jgi:hypothetical protein
MVMLSLFVAYSSAAGVVPDIWLWQNRIYY